MRCDRLRAHRIFDSLEHRLGAPAALRQDFMEALTEEGAEEFPFTSEKFDLRLVFLNRDGLWVVGWNPAEAEHRGMEKVRVAAFFQALRDANDMMHTYMVAHILSGCPVE